MESAMQQGTGNFTSGDVKIFYRMFGKPERSPVVLVHGLSYFSYDWIEPAKGLAVDREVVAMDMRGFGDSGWAKDYSISAFAGDIIGLLDHLRWDKAVLVGHSMGGRNCAYCAAKNTDRVAALVLVDWSPENTPAGSRRVAEMVAGTPDVFASVDDAMKYFGADPHSPQGARSRQRFEAYLRSVPGGYAVKRDTHFRDQFRRQVETGERHKVGVDLWATLRSITCPTLVIRASRSDLFASETAVLVKTANPELKLVEVDSGHNVAGDNPTALLKEMRTFLRALGI